MKNDYNKRLNNLRQRRETDKILKKSFLSESFDKTSYNENIKYVLESMKPIPTEYNRNTFEACERVQNQIKSELQYQIDISFRYQGSVVTDTNIKVYSDIDQLIIIEKFHWVKAPLVATNPYSGDVVNDVLTLRNKVKNIIQSKFPAVSINDAKGKCTSIEGGSLNRKIDLISASWVNTKDYNEYNNEVFRGIKIYDKNDAEWIENFPFMHSALINYKDTESNGNLKKLIRLIKTLKVDAEINIDISSYDIASILYNMNAGELKVDSYYPLQLLKNCNKFFQEIISFDSFRAGLEVPNKTRKIFGYKHVIEYEFVKLADELKNIINDIEEGMAPLIYEPIEKSFFNY